MNVLPEVIPDPEAAELMQPTIGPLHDPAKHPQPAAVRGAALGQFRVDPPVPQLPPLVLVSKAPVAQDLVRAPAGTARLAADGRGGIHQRPRLVGVRR